MLKIIGRTIKLPTSAWYCSLTLSMIAVSMSSLLCPAFALDPHKSIDQYGHNVWLRQSGLPANTVTAALQTRDGRLWLGTMNGLVRFDGVDFDPVIMDPSDPKNTKLITCLCQTKDGSLWIGTIFSGLRRLKDDSVSNFGLNQGFYDTEVWSILEDHSGHLLIGTSIGLYLYTGSKFRAILGMSNYVASICEDSIGRIWVGTHNGVQVFTEKSIEDGSDFAPVESITAKNGLSNDVVTYLLADRQGGIWIGTYSGLAYWKNGKISIYDMNNGLPDYHINSLFEDRDGNIWVGTRNGLSRFHEGKWETYAQSDGLSDNNVIAFAEDDEGSLWVCTSKGLNQFENANLTTYTTKEGLANNYLSSVIGTPDGSLYFLSDQGASVTRMRNGRDTVYNIPVGPAFVSRNGSLWIGQTGALYRIRNGVLTTYDSGAGLPKKWISAITEDDKSLILFVDHTQIFRFVEGRLAPYVLGDGRQYPPAGYVSFFFRQPDGVLWVGSADSLVKIQNGKITSYKTADGLAGNWTSSIYDDGQGNLWISSPQGGLSRYRDGKFTAYNTKVGLFTNAIFCVVGDSKGGLWLSSPRGIGYLTLKELNDFADGRAASIHTKVYGILDGMKTEECFGFWQPAGWKGPDGRLWFATRMGAVIIDVNAIKENKTPPPVMIERVTANDSTISPGHFVSLRPGTKNLEFQYTALSFLVPDRVLFKYKLEGYDRDWVDAGTRRTAFYTNLPPGSYTFMVIACNNDGVWNNAGAAFTFELRPEFYQTSWFYILFGVFLAGVVFGVYRYRVWQLLQRERELNARITEAMANIKVLGGLIPICSRCKKIRNDKGYWEHLEKYIQTHSEAQFSHGICPDCAADLYPDMHLKQDDK
ncbi:MAG TPA: two-component regulator propeller domain-containing protein [Candidatus Acidoferrales bacterium]|nr:two-component regulator propeller domain-containing protein [Candidatus Acidoferrales bacterium]